MKIKTYYLSSIGGYILVHLIWFSAALKSLAMPFATILLFDKSRAVLISLTLGVLVVILYFLSHGYSGLYDLKSLLLVLHFLIPASICRAGLLSREVALRDIVVVLTIFFIISVLFIDSFVLNGLDDSSDRFRGFVLFTLVALMQAYCRSRFTVRIFSAIIFAVIAFLITGSRQDSIILLISGLAVASRKNYFLIAIPLIYALMPAFTFIYSIVFPYAEDNIMVRARSAEIAISNISLFGNGLIPPVREFLSANNFGHYFVPADVMYLGAIYETGMIIFFIKLGFYLYLARRYWRRVEPAIIVVGCSAALFDYNLTHMAIEFASSAIVFKYLRVRRPI